MSSFGEALANSDILPSCRWNPQQLTKNCVFVTIAYLKGMSADELAEYIQRRMPSEIPTTLHQLWRAFGTSLLQWQDEKEDDSPIFMDFQGTYIPRKSVTTWIIATNLVFAFVIAHTATVDIALLYGKQDNATIIQTA
jgi:hypothetical protein